MKSPLIDASGDIVLRNGDFVVIDGDQELAQSVRVIYLTTKGEWFLNPEFGLDREPIFAKQFDEVEATDAYIEATGQEERIDSVETIEFTKIKRELNVELQLIKADGEQLTVSGV